jgi:hypothetical protein
MDSAESTIHVPHFEVEYPVLEPSVWWVLGGHGVQPSRECPENDYFA